MGYRNLQQAVADLERTGRLKRIDCEVDPCLEVGAIQRRVYRNGGPALLFTRVKGTAFPLLGNLFGTLERARYLFRDTLGAIETLAAAKGDPAALLRRPGKALGLLPHLTHLRPQRVSGGPLLGGTTTLEALPPLVSWPQDGGPFITLPQVYSEHPQRPGWRHSNLGMYRVQLGGNRYAPGREVGLHYQLHRGIGVHHAAAIASGRPLPVNVFVGGPPALTLAAVMPLPEGMPELAFAGLLAGHRLPVTATANGLLAPAEADFCLVGRIDPTRTLPEGPFGDHLGYYSLVHDFPVMTVERVLHRPGAIWPFTTVGRPPQEDTTFGALIHEMTGPLVPDLIPGVRAIHAVDAAGVHPLLLALGSERYVPYAAEREPRELLTQANAILGQGQLSLAKYLLIADGGDAPDLDLHDIGAFLRHLLARVDWRRDLHFQTCTTIDTLDYSGHGFNQGSKVVVAGAGPARRVLPAELPAGLHLPEGFTAPRLALPGVLVVKGPPWAGTRGQPAADLAGFCRTVAPDDPLNTCPLVVIADDSEFAARTLDNLLWVTFTRADPAADIDGVGAFTRAKHWGCSGALVVDARRKPHHPASLEDDPAVERRVDALGAPGGVLHGLV
ncbi:MAG: UbiD family decarboxylase [Deltaproteobacteria bacterium]|nr:MAG: UbiD family decarboxylase [Deltaproteobacteria bacterium]